MTINTPKELGAIIDLCRRKGVLSIEVSGMKIVLGDAPPKKLKAEEQKEAEDKPQYTPEDILMWSSAGIDG